MIEDDFYATIKFKNGEEIFTKAAASEEDNRTMLVISYPITVDEVKIKGNIAGYKVEPWLRTSTEDMFIINMDDILTLSESNDMEMIMIYQAFVRDTVSDRKQEPRMSRKMGYLGKVDDNKDLLEKIYKNSNYQPPQR